MLLTLGGHEEEATMGGEGSQLPEDGLALSTGFGPSVRFLGPVLHSGV